MDMTKSTDSDIGQIGREPLAAKSITVSASRKSGTPMHVVISLTDHAGVETSMAMTPSQAFHLRNRLLEMETKVRQNNKEDGFLDD